MSGRRRTRAQKRRARQPRTLRTRLVVGSVTLIAVVCAVIGTVTTIALRSHLYNQLDDNVAEAAMRAAGPMGDPVGGPSGGGAARPPSDDALGKDPLEFVLRGQDMGAIGATVKNGQVTKGIVSVDKKDSNGVNQPTALQLGKSQLAALASVAKDKSPHTVDIPGRGEYRVRYQEGRNGAFYVALPTDDVTNTLTTLIYVEISVTGAGLAAASLAGAAIVTLALRPLRKVAATATRVSELPLHTGEVTLYERVPESESDPHTEVGQVGAALNRMLDHIHGALHARQQSEMRVRQFVADASHELRTPLASIRGYAELTRRGR
jgi:two-component system OmpR family sensor kinase